MAQDSGNNLTWAAVNGRPVAACIGQGAIASATSMLSAFTIVMPVMQPPGFRSRIAVQAKPAGRMQPPGGKIFSQFVKRGRIQALKNLQFARRFTAITALNHLIANLLIISQTG